MGLNLRFYVSISDGKMQDSDRIQTGGKKVQEYTSVGMSYNNTIYKCSTKPNNFH